MLRSHMGSSLIILSMAVGTLSFVAMIRPLPGLNLPTKKRAFAVWIASWALLFCGAALVDTSDQPDRALSETPDVTGYAGSTTTDADTSELASAGGDGNNVSSRTKQAQSIFDFGNGTHLVGVDIAPGTYRSTGARFGCYWERLSGLGGELNDIIANDTVVEGSVIVAIAPTDYAFSSTGCGRWDRIRVQ